MPVRSTRALTLVEVLIAASIVFVLMGVVWLAVGPSVTEGRRQGACKDRLRDIYKAIVLYSQDNEVYEEVPGLGPLSIIALTRCPVLRPYLGGSKEALMCPDTPDCAKKTLASSYQWTFVGFDVGGKSQEWKEYTKGLLDRLRREGDRMTIVRCGVHDEMYYQPRERDLDPALAKPFLIELTMGGGIRWGRMPAPRSKMMERECLIGSRRDRK